MRLMWNFLQVRAWLYFRSFQTLFFFPFSFLKNVSLIQYTLTTCIWQYILTPCVWDIALYCVSSTYLVTVWFNNIDRVPCPITVDGTLFLDPICSKMTCASAWKSLGCHVHSVARCSTKGYSVSVLKVPERTQHTGSLGLLGHANFELPWYSRWRSPYSFELHTFLGLSGCLCVRIQCPTMVHCVCLSCV